MYATGKAVLYSSCLLAGQEETAFGQSSTVFGHKKGNHFLFLANFDLQKNAGN